MNPDDQGWCWLHFGKMEIELQLVTIDFAIDKVAYDGHFRRFFGMCPLAKCQPEYGYGIEHGSH
ncbi:hypothetical protein [Novipirellula artificiosorum]|uniref:Uncharacterized protein n=1 Tax=Novipirellula artificiosorum TaxID=2528016 RepID=A0A5C6D5P0_9BACT|nr:hypothetical protein [Novipirellula artificiosorum]TWU32170.1 hypothetical protein Poly41_56550 [Novipirellula artificiosorum]